LAVRFVSAWIAPRERTRQLAMNCALMGRCAGLVFMTLAPKVQIANNLLRYFLFKHQWFGVPLMRFCRRKSPVQF